MMITPAHSPEAQVHEVGEIRAADIPVRKIRLPSIGRVAASVSTWASPGRPPNWTSPAPCRTRSGSPWMHRRSTGSARPAIAKRRAVHPDLRPGEGHHQRISTSRHETRRHENRRVASLDHLARPRLFRRRRHERAVGRYDGRRRTLFARAHEPEIGPDAAQRARACAIPVARRRRLAVETVAEHASLSSLGSPEDAAIHSDRNSPRTPVDLARNTSAALSGASDDATVAP